MAKEEFYNSKLKRFNMQEENRVEILRLKAKQSGELIISFLLDGKKTELENLQFEKRFGDITDYKNSMQGANFVNKKKQ
jgi:hypothetical protein